MPGLGFFDGVRLGDLLVAFSHFGEALVVDAEDFQLGLGEVFDGDETVACPFEGGHDLVELELHRQGVAVLSPLDEEDHQKRDDGGAGVDDELPRIGVVEERPGRGPEQDDEQRG